MREKRETFYCGLTYRLCALRIVKTVWERFDFAYTTEPLVIKKKKKKYVAFSKKKNNLEREISNPIDKYCII